MNERKSFFYEATRKSYLNFFIWLMLITVPLTCIISFFGSVVISLVMEELISLRLPQYILYILWLLLLIGAIWQSFRNRLVFLSVDPEKLQLKNIHQAPFEIDRNQIHASDFDKKGRLILNNTILINTQGLPQKKRIELGTFLPEWLPEQTLTGDLSDFLKWKRQLQAQWQEGTTFSTIAQNNKDKLSLLRKISFVIFLILAGLLIWAGISGLEREVLVAIVPTGIFAFFLFLGIFEFTTFKMFKVDENGIAYQYGRKQTFFAWQDIEVIAFRIAGQRLLIWQGSNRYKSYSYSHIDSEDMDKVAQTIFDQAAIRNIPVAKV